jgi:hypothetical protein
LLKLSLCCLQSLLPLKTCTTNMKLCKIQR